MSQVLTSKKDYIRKSNTFQDIPLKIFRRALCKNLLKDVIIPFISIQRKTKGKLQIVKSVQIVENVNTEEYAVIEQIYTL